MSLCRSCGFMLEAHLGPLGACPDPAKIKIKNRSSYVPCEACGSTGGKVTDEPSVVDGRKFAVVNCPACGGRGWVLPKRNTL